VPPDHKLPTDVAILHREKMRIDRLVGLREVVKHTSEDLDDRTDLDQAL